MKNIWKYWETLRDILTDALEIIKTLIFAGYTLLMIMMAVLVIMWICSWVIYFVKDLPIWPPI